MLKIRVPSEVAEEVAMIFLIVVLVALMPLRLVLMGLGRIMRLVPIRFRVE